MNLGRYAQKGWPSLSGYQHSSHCKIWMLKCCISLEPKDMTKCEMDDIPKVKKLYWLLPCYQKHKKNRLLCRHNGMVMHPGSSFTSYMASYILKRTLLHIAVQYITQLDTRCLAVGYLTFFVWASLWLESFLASVYSNFKVGRVSMSVSCWCGSSDCIFF